MYIFICYYMLIYAVVAEGYSPCSTPGVRHNRVLLANCRRPFWTEFYFV